MIVLPPAKLWGFMIALGGGAVFGLTGFGFAMVAVPLMLIILPSKLVVPINVTLINVSVLVMLYETRKWIAPKRIWPLIIAGVLGSPLGTYLLLILDANRLKVLIGTVIALSALALLVGIKRHIHNERSAFAIVGLVSGLLHGSTGISGPPLVLFFSNQSTEKQTFRANLAVYFAVLGLATSLWQILGGLLTREVLDYVVWFVPALLVGTLVGINLARYVSEIVFRKLTLVVVIVTGLSSIASGVGLM
jgi:uncharacterized membrane protein YfcA